MKKTVFRKFLTVLAITLLLCLFVYPLMLPSENYFRMVLQMLPLTLLVLAPIGARLSEAFAGLLIMLFNTPFGKILVPIFCAIYPYIVITGMHFNLMAVAMAIGGRYGKNPITHPAGFLFQYTQAAACLAVAFKAKNAERKSMAFSCAFSDAIPGISEPGMYGITFKYRKLVKFNKGNM